MPVRNEIRHIQRTIACLQSQIATDFDLEFLLVDGQSDDGTREAIAEQATKDHRIRLLDNLRRHTPHALNVGLDAARGEYVCILGAHSEYPPDYIAICYRELNSHDVTACSGHLITVPDNKSVSARLAARCLTSKFASGNSVRNYRSGFVDTVPFPLIRKDAAIEAGGYDEQLLRNQDNDLNQRLRAHGHRLYLTSRTSAHYYARPGIGALLRYAYRTGLWNALTLRRNQSAMSVRHFVPLCFVLAVVMLLVASVTAAITAHSPELPLASLALLLMSHLSLGAAAGVHAAVREHDISALLLPPVILAFHCAYGAGTARGFLKRGVVDTNATRRQISTHASTLPI